MRDGSVGVRRSGIAGCWNNRQPVFASDEDYHFYYECLVDAAKKHECDVHAYVLMTNRVHLLVTPSTGVGIGKMMQSVGRRYVQYFKYGYQRTGTLWEGRYRATLIDAERYLLTCYRYIELNPVRAQVVGHHASMLGRVTAGMQKGVKIH